MRASKISEWHKDIEITHSILAPVYRALKISEWHKDIEITHSILATVYSAQFEKKIDI